MQYISNTESEKLEMLKAIGVSRFEDLLKDIPAALRVKGGLNLEAGLSEMELLRELRQKGQKNAHGDRNVTFLGAGNYDHYIPPIVGHLASRGEFITSYTPYQGEASQGTLQSIYEFQSLMCLLTGTDVANASMYDGASAMAEAALMAIRSSGRRDILVSEAVHPESIETLRTYISNIDARVIVVPQVEGIFDLGFLRENVTELTGAVIYQTPNFLGYLEDGAAIAQIAKSKGATVIAAVNPMALSLIEPPGATGADIVVGEGQPLGNPVSYGGPHFGIFAAKKEFMRKMPGRICGQTVDRDGKRAFVLTLQAREQHIRREKATSNICTNHALCALKATIFLTTLGENGFRKMGELNLERARSAYKKLLKVKAVRAFSKAPFFNEFTIQIDKTPARVQAALAKHRLLGPLHLGRFKKAWERRWLVAVTEQRSDEDIDLLVRAVRGA